MLFQLSLSWPAPFLYIIYIITLCMGSFVVNHIMEKQYLRLGMQLRDHKHNYTLELCSCVAVFLYACVAVFLCASVAVCLYACVPVCLCSCVPVCLCSCVPVCLCVWVREWVSERAREWHVIKIISVTMWPLLSTGLEFCSYPDNWPVVWWIMCYTYVLIKCLNSCKGFLNL